MNTFDKELPLSERLANRWEHLTVPYSDNIFFKIIHYLWVAVFFLVAIPLWMLEIIVLTIINFVELGSKLAILCHLEILWILPAFLLGTLKMLFGIVFHVLFLLCSLPNTIYEAMREN